jgi:hypothetical protein
MINRLSIERQTHHVPSRAMDGRSVDNTQTLVATIKVMDHQVTSNNKHREGALQASYQLTCMTHAWEAR